MVARAEAAARLHALKQEAAYLQDLLERVRAVPACESLLLSTGSCVACRCWLPHARVLSLGGGGVRLSRKKEPVQGPCAYDVSSSWCAQPEPCTVRHAEAATHACLRQMHAAGSHD